MMLRWNCRSIFVASAGSIFLLLSWMIFFFSGTAVAQEIPRKQATAARAIVLPPKLVAGEPATLAVIDSGSRLLPDVAVGLPGGQNVTTDSTGRATFVAPRVPGPLLARISRSGISASTVIVVDSEMAGHAANEGGFPAAKVTSYPDVLAIHDRFVVGGTGFKGQADSNRVLLADRQCLVIAASPIALVVLPGPNIPIGPSVLRVRVQGEDAGHFPVTAVLLDFSGPAEAPAAGTDGKLVLRVHGSTEPLGVEVRNSTPQIIQLARGNLQRVETSGGKENVASVDLKFLASGDFTITARLAPIDSGAPPRPN